LTLPLPQELNVTRNGSLTQIRSLVNTLQENYRLRKCDIRFLVNARCSKTQRLGEVTDNDDSIPAA